MQAVVDRIEGDLLIVRLDDGQELRVGRDKLGIRNKELREGAVLNLEFKPDTRETGERKRRVKRLLKEVFGK